MLGRMFIYFQGAGGKSSNVCGLWGRGGGVPKEKHYRQLERKVNFMSGYREL